MAMQRIPIEKKATPVCRRCAVPCVARLVRRLRNSRYALKQSSPKPPDKPTLLGGAQGEKSKTQKQRHGELRPPCLEIKFDGRPLWIPSFTPGGVDFD